MEVMTYVLDDRVWTREERDALPPDGSRHELIDGALVVTPSPHWRHQFVVAELLAVLRAACPEDLMALPAPLDLTLAVDTVVEPDLLVSRRSDFDAGRYDLAVPPLLVVEVLSPSTQVIDRNLKRRRYEAAGVPSFWVVDPVGPRLTAWELLDGAYIEVADVGPGESWTARQPFPVEIRPEDLLG
jgi:Uma2 family endonuclease